MKKLIIDFESRSPINLKKAGTWLYATHPQTEAMCVAFAFAGEGKKPVILTAEQIASPLCILRQYALDPDIRFVAHSAFFEYLIWNYILVPRFGYPPLLDPKRWGCTLARAAMCGLPLSLDKCGAALGLRARKDPFGKAAMLKLSKPLEIDPLGDPIYLEKADDPELYQKMLDYCVLDVESELELDERLPELPPIEQAVWQLDLLINHRGLKLDMDAAAKAVRMTKEISDGLNARLAVLTGGAVTAASQVGEIKRWLLTQGIEAESLDKHAVTMLLSDTSIPVNVREVLSIRRQVGKSSTAKYAKILDITDAKDGRARGLLQYHGAATGRFAGRALQPHNMPKGVKQKIQQEIIDAILADDPWMFSAQYGDQAMQMLSNALRGMIVAATGKKLTVADFAAIEARVVLWLAGDEAALEEMRRGVSSYLSMGRYLFGREISKEGDPQEYAISKATILGCFAADTLVLTQRGWIPVINIKREDKLWDGAEWVKHDGVAYQGRQETINLSGIRVTPDHLILTHENKWVSASQVRQEGDGFLKSATSMAAFELSGIGSEFGAESSVSRHDADADESRFAMHAICERGPQHVATPAPKRHLPHGNVNSTATPISCRTQCTEKDFLIESPLQFNGATIQKITGSTTMGPEEFSFMKRGGRIARNFFGTLLRFLGGMTPLWKWTAKITTVDTSRAISLSSRAKQTIRTAEVSENSRDEFSNSRDEFSNSKQRCAVYDIVNAGPRNRFVIRTNAGPLVVHNCGFQMGAARFVGNCAQNGIEISEEMALRAVRAYRTKHKPVVDLWYSIERAAANAIRTPGSVYPSCGGRVLWGMDKKREFLVCKLPAGRHLRYYKPSLQMVDGPRGEKEQIRYFTVDVAGNSVQVSTYGGELTENVTQAVARDLLVSGMLKAEAAGYPVVLNVHDEVVSEVPDEELASGEKSLEKFIALMCALPEWARGLPVQAEGFVAQRYRK